MEVLFQKKQESFKETSLLVITMPLLIKYDERIVVAIAYNKYNSQQKLMSLKDFVIIAKLGEGAYSSVYKVQRIVDSQIYALKKVKMNNLSDKEQENALNQVRILASLNSPYIVGYKHSFIESNSLCIVMEFLDDGDLYQKIVAHQKNNTTFDQQTVWKTLIHVTLGLKRLHDFNILHRDLKSANVFLEKSGVAKLGDMNVSKIAKNGLLYTQTGTPYYASPEVWKDKPYDSKSDIWSLGCVIYEMATLKPPFRAQDMDGLYKKVIKGVYTKIGDNYSKQLSQVIKNMLQVNPSSRPDATELLMSIRGKAEEMGIDVDHQTPPSNQLLKTIRAHKNLHYLTDRLPKSNYNNGHQQQKVAKLSQSTKDKNPVSLANYPQTKNINLPKLDRIILRNGANKYSQQPKKNQLPSNKVHQVDISNMLKIEGKGSQQMHPRYDYEYQLSRKQADRDIRAELRKIYNLKPSPKKHNRRVVQLPRIN